MESDLNRIASRFSINMETDFEAADLIVNRISELQKFYRRVHDALSEDKLPFDFNYS